MVTGVGLVSPLGIGTRETWDGLVAGRSGAGRITRFDASDFSSQIACEVKGFDPLDYADRRDARKMDTFIQYALAASLFAAEDAGLETPLEDPDRVGVVISSGIGGFETIEREHRKLLEKGPRRISPFFVPAMVVNLAAGWVSIRLGARGPNSAMRRRVPPALTRWERLSASSATDTPTSWSPAGRRRPLRRCASGASPP